MRTAIPRGKPAVDRNGVSKSTMMLSSLPVYNAMSLAVSRDERDPTEVAARFLAEHSLP